MLKTKSEDIFFSYWINKITLCFVRSHCNIELLGKNWNSWRKQSLLILKVRIYYLFSKYVWIYYFTVPLEFLCFSITPLISIKHNGNGEYRLGWDEEISKVLVFEHQNVRKKPTTIPRLSFVFYIFRP